MYFLVLVLALKVFFLAVILTDFLVTLFVLGVLGGLGGFGAGVGVTGVFESE